METCALCGRQGSRDFAPMGGGRWRCVSVDACKQRQRIAKFVGQLKGETPQQQRMIALSELSRIHRRKHPGGEPYAATTNRRTITEYRNAIREALGDSALVLNTFRYSEARTAEYKAHQAEQRKQQHHNQRPLDASKHVEAATVLLEYTMMLGWSIPAAIAGVIALTGRRPYEVGCVGRFEPDPDNEQQIIFSGQTKTRHADWADQPYPIPVLARRDLVLDAIAKLRKTLDPNMPNKTFSNRWARYYGEEAKKYFRDGNGEPILPRELREAYATIAFDRFAPKTTSAVQYYNSVLGHHSVDLETSLFYFAFYLTEEKKKPKPARKKGTRSRRNEPVNGDTNVINLSARR